MSRPSYVCTVCSQHFTRKYSGQRHNFNIHSGRSEIVPYIEYMAGGRSVSGKPSIMVSQAERISTGSHLSLRIVLLLTLQVHCASYIDNIDALPYKACPTCNHTAIELLPLSNGEQYRFESSATRGIILEFSRKSFH